MTAPCSSVPITTPALDMPLGWREQACEIAAGLAVLNNMLLVIVGEADGFEFVICTDEECAARPGVLVAVPDTEAISRGWTSTPAGAMRLDLADGRSCLIFRGTA